MNCVELMYGHGKFTNNSWAIICNIFSSIVYCFIVQNAKLSLIYVINIVVIIARSSSTVHLIITSKKVSRSFCFFRDNSLRSLNHTIHLVQSCECATLNFWHFRTSHHFIDRTPFNTLRTAKQNNKLSLFHLP